MENATIKEITNTALIADTQIKNSYAKQSRLQTASVQILRTQISVIDVMMDSG
jgi:methylphosphotriester-DNA--protein-cysteine methyltransferase